MKHYPGLNRLLVKKLELPKTDSVITTTANLMHYGEIVAVGAIKDKESIDSYMFNVNDKVYYLSQAGVNIDLPDGTYRLINVTDVLVGEQQQ